MRVPGGLARRLPRGPGVGDRLVGAGFVLAQHHQSLQLPVGIGALDQVFLGAVSGSVTSTAPAFRLRMTVPVLHQVRDCCQV
jgi:hypothetical protein